MFLLKKMIIISIAVIVLGVVGMLLLFNPNSEDKQNGEKSMSTMIHEYTKDKSDVKLTIGVLKAGKTNFKVFGEDFKELEPIKYQYEIGSISKTFTASILCKAIADGRINLNDSISKYLPLDSNTFYPTVLSLATHTSGYGKYPFSSSELSKKELKKVDYDFYENKINIYQGINRADTLNRIKTHVLKNKSYGWEYSNFGMAVLGTTLGEAMNLNLMKLV